MPWERDGASTRNFSPEKCPCISRRAIFMKGNEILMIWPGSQSGMSGAN